MKGAGEGRHLHLNIAVQIFLIPEKFTEYFVGIQNYLK